MKESIEFMRNRHVDQAVWIVGKGPSLQYLNAGYFGNGPIITINEAILSVQDLPLANTMYAMNKDGCRNEAKGHTCPMVEPWWDVNMILQAPGFSEHCFPNHPNRLWINPVDDLGFDLPTVLSVRMCIAIAKLMGGNEINLISCDSLVNGDMRIFDGKVVRSSGASGHYSHNISIIKKELEDIKHHFILPRKNERQTIANA